MFNLPNDGHIVTMLLGGSSRSILMGSPDGSQKNRSLSEMMSWAYHLDMVIYGHKIGWYGKQVECILRYYNIYISNSDDIWVWHLQVGRNYHD